MLTGLALFGIASLGCSLAPSTGLLVAFRVAQGAGAALMLPGTLAVIAHAYPDPSEQTRAIGLWAGVDSTALIAGPPLGGVLTHPVGWRAVFVVNLPIVALALPIAARAVLESADQQGKRLAVRGILLAAGALTAATYHAYRPTSSLPRSRWRSAR